MGFLARMSTITPRAEIGRGSGYGEDFWYLPDGWVNSLSMAGVGLSPELAMTLSHVHCAVSTISDDFGTMTCQLFKDLGDEGHSKVKFSDPGIGNLAYRLRWQPNQFQSAKAFWSTLAWQYLLRPAAYAEIVYKPGSDLIVNQLIPRTPDRVREERLPNGRITYRLTEADGSHRYVTEEEMFVVRNTSTDGLNAISRIEFGGKLLSTAMALQDFTRNYFKKGATAALLATYKGAAEWGDEEEEALHRSMTRYVSGVENAGGILLVPEDIAVTSLGVEPEKAQLLGLKDLSGRDIARLFKLPPHKLGIAGTTTYASQVQSAQEYSTGCLMPITVEFEQAIFIHLIVGTNFYAKFNMDYLVRASLKERYEAYEIGIRSRLIRPSEARVREDMNPDEELDRLSEMDHRPGGDAGGSKTVTNNKNTTDDSGASSRRSGIERRQDSAGPWPDALEERRSGMDRRMPDVRATLFVHDQAMRVLRRECQAVEKLAKKHAADVSGWQAGLREFYEDHAGFVADTLRVPMDVARAYAAQHGSDIEAHGLPLMNERWVRLEAEELTTLALDPEPIRLLIGEKAA